MKIVRFGPDGRTGVLDGVTVVDISLARAKYLAESEGATDARALAESQVPSELRRFIEGGAKALDAAQQALDYLSGGASDQKGPGGEALTCPVGEAGLLAPRPLGSRIACAGGNFADHAAAMAARSAARGGNLGDLGDSVGDLKAAHEKIRAGGIWGFWKVHRESLAPGGEVIYPARAKRLDYEGEPAIVIGKEGKDIPASDILDYVWGVTLLGDWSIRLASEGGPLKFATQKNFDTSCSLGPCITVGEADPLDIEVETLVNGERRQHFNSKDMVFTFAEYLAHLSTDFTFYPGDIISGGTAAGTAADSAPLLDDGTPSPETFLKVGDAVEIKSPSVGTLAASVVANP
jgi:acylpyruvate hydrolase